MSVDSLEDEAMFFNLGQYSVEKFMNFKLLPPGPSSWTNYPYQYKFISFHWTLNMDINYIDRTTYDFLTLCGDVGGVLGILTAVFSALASPFAVLKIKAMVTSRLFHLSAENRTSLFDTPKLSE